MVWSRTLSLSLLALLACHYAAAETLLVQFTTPECGPCRRMRPVIQRLAAEGYAVREVDGVRDAQVATQYQITNYPTFLVLVDGRERARLVGSTTHARLVEMIHKAAAIGAAQRTPQPTAAPAATFVQNNPFAVSSPAPATTAEPLPGRVVPLQTEPPVSRTPREPSAASNVSSPTTAGGVERLIAATVRLTIEDPEGQSTGTGTIVDAREGRALVLTCGHLFRSSGGKGPIQISLFTAGANGAELRTTAEGTLVDYDLERDLALVCFMPDGPIAVAPVAPAGTPMQVGAAVTSVGCEHGANPTPWPTRVTAIDRYQGHPNIEAAGAPVEGRSGGGLFNAAGQLVGVCNAADPQGNEGLYASLPSIHAKLDSLKLSFVHQAPSLVDSQPSKAADSTSLASAPSPQFEVRGQNPTPAVTPVLPAAPQALSAGGSAEAAVTTVNPIEQGGPLDPQEQAAIQELHRRSVESEVICIIRPRTPGGRSEVIKLDKASPAFVRALGGGSAGDAARVSPAERLTAQPAAAGASPLMR